jgi:hypothetical protein
VWTQREAEDQNQKNGVAGDQGQVTGVTQEDDMKLEVETSGRPSLRTVETERGQSQMTGVPKRRRGHHHEEGGYGGLLLRTRVGKEARYRYKSVSTLVVSFNPFQSVWKYLLPPLQV